MTQKEEPGHLLGQRPRSELAGCISLLMSAWSNQELSRGPQRPTRGGEGQEQEAGGGSSHRGPDSPLGHRLAGSGHAHRIGKDLSAADAA